MQKTTEHYDMNPDGNESFEAIFAESRTRQSYWEELAILNFTNSVLNRLDCLGMNKRGLADSLDVSPAYVAKLIGGSNNFTLRTMVKIARVLKSELVIGLRYNFAEGYEWLARDLSDSEDENEVAFQAADHEELSLAA